MLLGTGEDQGLITPVSALPAEHVLSSAFSIGNRLPSSPLPLPTAQAESVMEWKEVAETTNHADFRPASPSESSCSDDARDDGLTTTPIRRTTTVMMSLLMNLKE